MIKKLVILFSLLIAVSPLAAEEAFVQQLLKTDQSQQLIPHYLADSPSATETSAYQTQKFYVDIRKQTDPIAGYKAGLTSKASQKKLNVSQALSGTLFSSGYLSNTQTVNLNSAKKLMIETEIGFILSQPIKKPIKNLTQLSSLIESVAAVIELPNLGYANPKKLTGLDLIASNLASHQYLVGNKLKLKELPDINQIKTRLTYQNETLFTGNAKDALGDQWQALYWLINHLLAQGYTLSEGDLLITGALGKMVPAQKGNYHANFGPLGDILFKVN
ncbi:2-keto-4-pentenoate hydratase [Aliikangiella sp. IMCC44359]|uniref:2-keto-4-pentenoate hydratase n=1 Tax=Aliikangiella sp. IMCC44359 TaxID=3459125 RepID=UPI00403B179B